MKPRCLLLLALLATCLMSACSLSKPSPPQITITPIEDVQAPKAGSSACPLPLIYMEPAGDYRKIAIIEGYGALGQDQEVVDAAQRAACETGADALLVVSDVSQDGLNLHPQIGQQGEDSLTRNTADTAKAMLAEGKLKGVKPAVAGRAGFFLEEYAIVYGARKRRAGVDRHQSPPEISGR